MEANNQPPVQQTLPNATAVLVLGIISIALCWCYGIIGLTLGIIALVLSGKSLKLIIENQQLYSNASIANLKAGRICAIIGTCLSGLSLLFYIIYISIVGFATIFSMNPWENFN